MTELFITVKNIGFTIFHDMARVQHLINPAFLSFFHEDYPPTEEEYNANQNAVEEFMKNSKNAFPVLPPPLKMYYFKGVYTITGHGVAKCSDNKLRWCRTVHFAFEYNGKLYNELFYIDKSLHVPAILGKDFQPKSEQI